MSNFVATGGIFSLIHNHAADAVDKYFIRVVGTFQKHIPQDTEGMDKQEGNDWRNRNAGISQ
jgi:hypothetical protein